MKKILLSLVVIAAGVGTGAGAGLGASMLLADGKPPAGACKTAAEVAADNKPVFVLAGDVKTPVVFDDGRLAGYVQFTVQLEVPQAAQQAIGEQLPLLLNAINMRTFKTPMARSPDGRIPDLDVFRALVMDASAEAFGKGKVTRALITDVTSI